MIQKLLLGCFAPQPAKSKQPTAVAHWQPDAAGKRILLHLLVNSKGHVACKITAAAANSASPIEALQLHGRSDVKALAGTLTQPALHATCGVTAVSSSSTGKPVYQGSADSLKGTQHASAQPPSRLILPEMGSAPATFKAASTPSHASCASPFGDRQHQVQLAGSMESNERVHGTLEGTIAACTGTKRVTSGELAITPRRKPPPLPSNAMQSPRGLVPSGSCPLPENNTATVSNRAVQKSSTTRRRTRASAGSIPDRNLFRKGVVVDMLPETQQQSSAKNPTNPASETRLPCKPPCSLTSPAILISAASSRSASTSNEHAKKAQSSWFSGIMSMFEGKTTRNMNISKDGVKRPTDTGAVLGKPNHKFMSLSALPQPTGRPSSDTISTVPDVAANQIHLPDSDDDVDDDDDLDTLLDLGNVQYVRMMSNRHSLSGRPAGDVLVERQRRRSSYHSGFSSSMRSIVSVVEDVEAFYCFPTEVRI